MVPQSISHYRIISLIGAGGMGEVYLAEDVGLGRKVAVKLLPADHAQDEDRLRRFKQEAQAISALNHPNILTIYEIGHKGSLYFIATEFIEGETLRQRLTRAQLKTIEVLDISIQIGAALAAAHAIGIIHRDIKPENIMLRPDGYVKILDFGLAKLTENLRGPAAGSEAPTAPRVDTAAGTVMGTVSYMSPEQLRRLSLDARTDIWSLGVTLYLMISGRLPFEGSTESDVIATILEREPPPLARYLPEAPPELTRILSKTLRKDRDERYQTVKDLLIDLKALKNDLEFLAKIEFSPQVGRATGPETASGKDRAEGPAKEPAKRWPSFIRYPIAVMRRRKFAAVVVLFFIAIASAAIYYALSPKRAPLPFRPRRIPFQNSRAVRIPYTDKAIRIAVSPQGTHVAFVEKENDRQSIVYQPIVATASRNKDQPGRIVPPAEGDTWGLSFSPDGQYIYYLRDRKDQVAVLYRVHVLESISRKVTENLSSPITLSPDGSRMAFIRSYPTEGRECLIVANTEDGSGEYTLATRTRPGFLTTIVGPEWSPDGKEIAFVAGSDLTYSHQGLFIARVKDGVENPLTTLRWDVVGRFAWLSDGKGLIIPGADRTTGKAKQLWHVSYPRGDVQQLTSGTSNYISISLSNDSKSMVAMQSNVLSHFWVATGHATNRARVITSGAFSGHDPCLMPDGKVAYVSETSGNEDIWVMGPDGKNQTQLTFDPNFDRSPWPTRDGRYIIFISDRGGSLDVWRMDSDGRNLKQITFGADANSPSCSPDGQWVVYCGSDISGRETLWKVPIDGGDPVRLSDAAISFAVVSPDGQLIVCYFWDEKVHGYKTGVLPFTGGDFVKSFDFVPDKVRWAPDSASLIYLSIQQETQNLWALPLDGSNARRLTDFKELEVYSFDFSYDENFLICERGSRNTNAILLRNPE
jgi:Tol biopolymer transport system component